MLQFGPGWWGSNATRSNETARIHHAHRRGGVAAHGARAQQPSKLPMIGVIGGGTPSTHGQSIAGFVQRLRELGWIEDRTVAIEIRWAEGRSERYTEIAVEFVRREVDVIFTSGAAVRGKAGHIRHPDRVRGGSGPTWRRLCREL